MTKIAIVTGANKGIGFEIAKQIAQMGVKTILACRTGHAAEIKLKENGLDVEFRLLDVSDVCSIDSFCEKIATDYGKLDILVNNAGISPDGPLEIVARPTFQTNYFGTINLTERLLPLLRKSLEARIVNVASTVGQRIFLAQGTDREMFVSKNFTLHDLNSFVEKFIADAENERAKIPEIFSTFHIDEKYFAYSQSKIAVIAATKIFARDPTNGNILINAVCPGHCDTDINNHEGTRPAAEGATSVVQLAVLHIGSTLNGKFFREEEETEW